MHSDLTAELIKTIANHALPFAILFVIIGLVLSFLISRAEKGLFKFIREGRARRTSRKGAVPPLRQNAEDLKR